MMYISQLPIVWTMSKFHTQIIFAKLDTENHAITQPYNMHQGVAKLL